MCPLILKRSGCGASAESFLGFPDQAVNAVFEQGDVEVDQQTNVVFSLAEIGQKLFLVHRLKCFLLKSHHRKQKMLIRIGSKFEI